MNTIIAAWMLVVGLVAVLRPGFFYNSRALTPEKITRNKRIWRWCGGGLIGVGTIGLLIELVRR